MSTPGTVPPEFNLPLSWAGPEGIGEQPFDDTAPPEALEIEGDDPRIALRRTLGLFATGVTIITTRVGEQVHGMTANAFMSVSLEPPLVLISVDRRTKMCGLLHEGSTYGVSVLCEGQSALSDRFAGRPGSEGAEPRFEVIHNTPLVDGRARGLRLEGRALVLGRRPLAVPRPRRVRAHGRGHATAVPRRPLRAPRVRQRRLSAVAGRHLDWDGCFNVRDLGGLPAADGMVTRRGALVRADALDRLTAEGWRTLAAHGVRTVIDLRGEDEQRARCAPRPPVVATLHVPLGRLPDAEVRERWGDDPVFATPLYYREYIDRFPRTLVAAVTAFAHAAPGGVAVHCSGGRDRTGLVTLAILTVAGVGPEDVVDDYLLSAGRQPARFAALGVPDPAPVIEAYLRREGTTAEAAAHAFLRDVDVAARLRAAGLADSDVAALRARTLEPAPG